jgi:hypothetical protein
MGFMDLPQDAVAGKILSKRNASENANPLS